ncbi:DUF6344 domain-containing protein [Streptomyces sp. SP18CS02]|uniref:DUF6344 domain-containing protein n=1 Tax=Streptomyces sp. SP18CS02 TaxID=3002531 RepID=UPI002E781279|nr:DUF6344 domain-containing protein [Streptomyces sp. SP18CS02]MEE1754382.1 DUF6344 domain-containing protein [Streptomyces sp. SP18CS02]
MAAVKVKQFWTAFISALFALLASVGPKSAVASARRPLAQPPVARREEPAVAAVRAAGPVPAQAAHGTRVRERSLPPTIKQRIRAEAHGSSPAVRRGRPAAVPTAPFVPVPVAAAEADPVELTDRADRFGGSGGADGACAAGPATRPSDLALAA